MRSTQSPCNTKKRFRDSGDEVSEKFDIHTWLMNQPNSELKSLIQSSVIPMMRKKRHAMHDAEIYQLFTQEPDYFIAKSMSDTLELLLSDVPYPEYLHDMLAIYQFLRHNQIVESYLDTLEQAVQKYAAQSPQRKHLITNFAGKYALPALSLPPRREWNAETIPYRKSFKILSGYLYQWAKDQGFTHRAKILATLTPQRFQSLLASKSIFKDSASSLLSTHGMWSHTIQWWCVFAHDKQSGFLQNDPIDMYAKMGEVDSKFWNRIFDNGPTTEYFTSPEFLTETILADVVRWPLLAGTLQNQKLKIEHDPLNNDRYKNHLRQKHPGHQDDNIVKRLLP
jgi:hypothetical protein